MAVVSGTFLPYLARRDLLINLQEDDDDDDSEDSRLRDAVLSLQSEAIRKGKPLRPPRMPLLLRNIWTGALLLFTLLMFSTFFITKVSQVRQNCLERFGWYDPLCLLLTLL